MAALPVCVVIFSGKRKCGKDYITELLQNSIGADKSCIVRLSGPLKAQYAKEHGLDLERLLDASDYKEKYRADMIRWGEEKRAEDPGYFVRIACRSVRPQEVWIISDTRRMSDVRYFKDHYADSLVTVRVEADESVRAARGWTFTRGVDDAESECGLDGVTDWDYVIDNNGDADKLKEQLKTLVERAMRSL